MRNDVEKLLPKQMHVVEVEITKDVVDSRRGFGRQTRRELRQPVVRVTRTLQEERKMMWAAVQGDLQASTAAVALQNKIVIGGTLVTVCCGGITETRRRSLGEQSCG